MIDLIASGRRELADLLGGLGDRRWRGPSLCAGWTVAHVTAHLTMPFRISEQEFVAALQRSGGEFTAVSDGIADRDSLLPQAELVAVLRDNADNPWSPPGGGPLGALSHDVVHGLDIAWPLRIGYPSSDRAVAAVLDLVTGTGDRSLFGFPLAGVRLSATDLDWSAGSGALLAGRSRDLLLLLAGRQLPSELFHGPAARHLATVPGGGDDDRR